MPWNILQVGKPAEAKAALVDQFNVAQQDSAGNAQELAGLALVQQAINSELDFLSQFDDVSAQVSTSGASKTYTDPHGKQRGESQLSLEVITVRD